MKALPAEHPATASAEARGSGQQMSSRSLWLSHAPRPETLIAEPCPGLCRGIACYGAESGSDAGTGLWPRV